MKEKICINGKVNEDVNIICIIIINLFSLQIEDLQLSMTRMEKEHGRREDSLRQEISDLQQVVLVHAHVTF